MKAYIYLTLLFLVLLMTGYFFREQLGLPVSNTASQIFFWLQACFIHSVNLSSLKKDSRAAIIRLLLSVVVRFISSGIFLLVMIYNFPDYPVSTISVFLLLFVLFAGAEIVALNDARKNYKL